MNKVSNDKKQLLQKMVESIGPIFTRKQALSFVTSNGGTVADIRWVFNNKAFRAGRGQYDVSSMTSGAAAGSQSGSSDSVETTPTVTQ